MGAEAWMGEGDIMPGIQLIKFSVFELLSAIFTRFASVHFRVLFQPAPWIARRPKKGSGISRIFSGGKRRGKMINVITSDGGCERKRRKGRKRRVGNESTRIDNLAIENAINLRLNLIRSLEGWAAPDPRPHRKENPKTCHNRKNIYEYKLKNICALSSS